MNLSSENIQTKTKRDIQEKRTHQNDDVKFRNWIVFTWIEHKIHHLPLGPLPFELFKFDGIFYCVIWYHFFFGNVLISILRYFILLFNSLEKSRCSWAHFSNWKQKKRISSLSDTYSAVGSLNLEIQEKTRRIETFSAVSKFL